MDERENSRGINILCFDGGGVRGLSSLVLLGEIMRRLGDLEIKSERADPAEYFDVIAGTGTGGISACMLGRLGMPLDQAIDAYVKLLSKVFSDKKAPGSDAMAIYKGTRLRELLRLLVRDSTGNPEDYMRDRTASKHQCKSMVFAMSKHHLNAGIPVIFRSYESNINPAPDCTIWEALYATMAHPEFFKSISILDSAVQQHFVGGDVGCSNPLVHVLSEVRRLYPGRRVSCVLSLGAGHARTISLSDPGLSQRLLGIKEVAAMKDMATDSERVAEDIATRFQDTDGVYYRFNVDQGMQDMNADDWVKLGEMTAHARVYIGKVDPSRRIDRAAKAIKERAPRVPVEYIDGHILAPPYKQPVGIKHCPAPSSVFTGREDLIKKISTCIASGTTERRVCVVHGLGGAGKTQLVLKVVERHRDHWIHVFYVDASSREAVESALQDVAKAKDIGVTHEDTLRWLETSREPWLLVYDNADHPWLHIHEYFPGGNRGSILITTRLSDMRVHAKGPSSDCRISQMSHEDALMLFLLLTHMQGQILIESETKAANALLEDFGYLALAIVHAGAYIGHSHMPVTKYRDLFLARRRSMLERYTKLKVKVDSYQSSVFTTWKLCYDLLEEQSYSRPLLWIAAYMHHDCITESIFERSAIQMLKAHESDLPETKAEEAARTYVREFLSRFLDEDGVWDTTLFSDAMSELTSYSLMEYDRANAVYNVHVLVQEWARTVIPQPEDLAIECTATLLSHAIDFGDSAQAYRSRDDLGVHVIKVLSEQGDKISINHASRFAEVLRVKRLWGLQERLETRVKEARERTYGGEHLSTLRSMNNLAATYWNQGRWDEAEQLHIKTLDARRRTLGDEHQDTLTSMINLALIHFKRGRWNDAERLQVKVLDAHRRTLGEEHPDTLMNMNNLSATYSDQGRWDEAEELQVGVLDARRRTLGKEHPDTLMSMSNLASTYWHQGRWDEAEQLQAKALDTRRQTLGEEHPDTLMSMANLALTYSDQGRWKKAEQLQLKTLDAYMQALGEEHSDTLTSKNNLALTYSSQGRWKEAEQLQDNVLDARRRTLGEEHPDTLTSMNNLVSTYLSQDRSNEAEQLGLKVVAVQRRVVGEDHPDTLASMNNLAAAYSAQGRWSEAEQLHFNTLNARRRTLGEEHPETLTSSNNVASSYLNQGRFSEAEELHVKTLNMRKRALGEEHPDTLMSLKNLASTYQNQGRLSEAEELQVKLLDKLEQTLGEEHPDTLGGMHSLAYTYSEQGRWIEAERLGVKVVATRKRILGGEHRATLRSMNHLALIYVNQGRLDEAKKLLIQVVEVRTRILGDQHPETIYARENLASIGDNLSADGADGLTTTTD